MLISSVNLINAQSYTEKYNDLYNRYEYFNNQGRMIGYKYYDNLYKVWKYKDISESSQNSYTSPVNSSLINQALATKQARFDENVKRVQNAIDDINSQIIEMDVSDAIRNEMNIKFKNRIKLINSKNIDYSNNTTVKQVIEYLYSNK